MSGTSAHRPLSLDSIVGASNTIADPAQLSPMAIDGIAPRIAVRPANPGEIAEIVRFCAAEKLALVPVGAATKLSMGAPPARYDVALLTSRLDRILSYDPGDLTVSVEAGVRLADLSARLASQRQFLPLEVPFSLQATIGGTAASGVDSPLRQRYGSTRDFLLGAEFVTGEAHITHSGGRVVKNVAGYDLHKLFLGSLGALGVLTRLNFKTFPMPEAVRGYLASFPTEAAALKMLASVAASPLAPASLEIFDPAFAVLVAQSIPATDPELSLPGDWFPSKEWLVGVDYGGNPAVLRRISGDLDAFASAAGASRTEILEDDRRPAVWSRLREAIPLMLAASPLAAVVRVSVVPSRIGEILAAARRSSERHAIPTAVLARGVGVLYVAFLPAANDEASALAALASAASELTDAAAAADGFSSIPWAPAPLKSRISVWGRERADLPLMRRVKLAFDPAGIFSPGRFLGGI